MNAAMLEGYKHLWTTEIGDHGLLMRETRDGIKKYLVYNMRAKTALLVDDRDLNDAIVEKMIAAGAQIGRTSAELKAAFVRQKNSANGAP